jgi:hypothetical protein
VRARAHRTADASRSNGSVINTLPGQAATKPATPLKSSRLRSARARWKLISQGEDTSRAGVSSLDARQTASMLAFSRRARQWSWTFGIANSSVTRWLDPRVRFDDRNDPYVVLLYEARNIEHLGVPSSSDKAVADLLLGLLSMLRSDAQRRPEATKPASLTCSQAVPAGPAPRRSHRRVARSSARRKHPLPTPPA